MSSFLIKYPARLRLTLLKLCLLAIAATLIAGPWILAALALQK